jgi:hypothetical protein
MLMTRSIFVATLALSLFACSSFDGSQDPIGENQNLLKKKSGGASGDGQTCSWDGVVSYDVATGKETLHSDPNAGGYAVGASFPSPDGCNTCTCTAQGIACTLMWCEPKGCTAEAKICPDGSAVGRTGPNCEFAPCPGEPKACTEEAKICPDGSAVGRTGPNCEFAPCPGEGIACPADAKMCPDGSYVGRTGPNCEFAPCP